MVSQNISQSADERGLIACFCVGAVFVVMRLAARWYKLRRPPLQLDDIFMYLALVSFAITTALYYATIATFFNLMAIEAGKMAPYASLQSDLVVMLKEFFVVQFFFWLTLWAVKWSLLFMFKRLTDGLPRYNMIWWAVLAFSIITFIGACVSNFTSCSSMHAWFTAGECTTARDSRAKDISLWFALAADLATDVLVMAVPIRVLYHLRVSLLEKISIALVFMVGLLTMVTAIIRAVSLEASASAGQVSTTWLMLWAGIECTVAIIVGCLPSFAVFIRSRVNASRALYEANSKSTSGPNSRRRVGSGPRSLEDNSLWQTRDTASEKSLVDGGGIMVTRSFSQRWQTKGGSRSIRTRDGQMEHELQDMGA